MTILASNAPATLNLSFDRLPRWAKAVGQAVSGTASSNIFLIGDSMTTSWGASGVTGVNARPYSYPLQFAANLLARGIPINDGGFFSDQNVSTGGITGPQYDTRVVFGSGWTTTANSGFCGGSITNSTTTNALAFTPLKAFDTLDVYYIAVSGGGSATVDVDGGTSLGTINFNQTPAMLKVRYSVSLATHTVNIRRVSGSCTVFGVMTANSTAASLQMFQLSHCGAKTADLTTANFPVCNLPNFMALTTPALSIIDIGGNDCNGGTALSAVTTSLQSVVSNALSLGDAALLSWPPSSITLTSTAVQASYINVLNTQAASSNIAFFDVHTRWPSYEILNPLGYYFDTVHPTNFGYDDIAGFVAGSLASVTPIQSPTLAQANSVYTLPAASTSTLGGIKVDGSSLTISNSVASANRPGTLNLTRDKLPYWGRALGQALAGTASANVFMVGDGTTHGSGSSGSNFANCRARSYPALFAAALAAKGMNVSDGGFFGDQNTSALSGATGTSGPSYDPRYVWGAGWSTTPTPFIFGGPVTNSTTTNPLAFTPAGAFNTIEVYYSTIANQAGSATIDIDGGATLGTINFNIVTNSVLKATYSCSLGNHTVNARRVSGTCYILGIMTSNSTAPGLRMYQMGSNLATASNITTNDNAYWNIPTMSALAAPALTIVTLGLHDTGGTPLSTFNANIQAIINTAKLTGDVVLVGTPGYSIALGIPATTQQFYIDAMRALAISNNVVMLDMRQRLLGGYEVWNPYGYYSDTVALSGPGHSDMAGFITECLTWNAAIANPGLTASYVNTKSMINSLIFG